MGKCNRGEKCEFLHRKSTTERGEIWCRYDKEGRCRNGEFCKYKHGKKQLEQKDREKQTECRFYKRMGTCKYKENGKYYHNIEYRRTEWHETGRENKDRMENKEMTKQTEEKIIFFLTIHLCK